eukprot:14200229-Alexandrium_andersonii.AAC.1
MVGGPQPQPKIGYKRETIALDVGPHMAPEVLYNRGPSTRGPAMVQVGVLGRRQVRGPVGQCPGPRGPVGGLTPARLPKYAAATMRHWPLQQERSVPLRRGQRGQIRWGCQSLPCLRIGGRALLARQGVVNAGVEFARGQDWHSCPKGLNELAELV